MIAPQRKLLTNQTGIVLVSSLLLLLVVTIMAVSMFRSFGIQEKIAGNVREKQRALHAAEVAQQYAESWLSNGGAAATPAIACTAGLLDANTGPPQICNTATNLVALAGSATSVPWKSAGNNVGITYTPTVLSAMNVTLSSVANSYYFAPRFYISDAGPSATGQGEIYQIDAVGSGGTANAIAVVESTYSVYTSSWDPSK